MLGAGEGIPEGVQRVFGIGDRLVGDADRPPRGRGPTPVPDAGAMASASVAGVQGFVAAVQRGQCLGGVPQRVGLTLGVSDRAGELQRCGRLAQSVLGPVGRTPGRDRPSSAG